jgi:hypothetical protein
LITGAGEAEESDKWLFIFRRRRCFGEYVVWDKREEWSHVKGDPCFEILPPATPHSIIAILVLVLILGEERNRQHEFSKCDF